jgi:hypothetical protein
MGEQEMSDNPIENAVTIGEHGNLIAKDGWVWGCQHCGKKSRDQYGLNPISYGYDESCALNSKLIRAKPAAPTADAITSTTHNPGNKS